MKIKKNNKIIINMIIIFIILSTLTWLIREEYKETKIQNKQTSSYDTQILSTQENQENAELYTNKETNTLVEETTKEYPKEEIINEYKGYDVAAKLEIPKIELETYILQNYSEKALNISVTKFYGANANEIGNFCVAGHNFKNKNMFHNLKELEITDIFFISNNKIGKVEYEIYDIYKVFPEDTGCLLQETNNTREVTLITCTNDSEKRIIVKAKEVEM